MINNLEGSKSMEIHDNYVQLIMVGLKVVL